MNEKTVTTRKDHTCAMCEETIPKGSRALYCSTRAPRYENAGFGEEQVGIEYINFWTHAYDCLMPEECKQGNHEWEEDRDFFDLGAPTGKEYCVLCGTEREPSHAE